MWDVTVLDVVIGAHRPLCPRKGCIVNLGNASKPSDTDVFSAGLIITLTVQICMPNPQAGSFEGFINGTSITISWHRTLFSKHCLASAALKSWEQTGY